MEKLGFLVRQEDEGIPIILLSLKNSKTTLYPTQTHDIL